MDDKYAVTLYVAAPGTPLLDGGTSAAGRMYYTVTHGNEQTNFGFAPHRTRRDVRAWKGLQQ
jgi:hypothetical protein